jgi:hypothetical protein
VSRIGKKPSGQEMFIAKFDCASCASGIGIIGVFCGCSTLDM